jgi:hypothetical protein
LAALLTRSWADRAADLSGNNDIRRSAAPPSASKNRIIGRAAKSADSAHNVQSAKPYVNKVVFGIYNVNNDESVESLSDFIKNTCDLKPVSCFKVKSNNAESAAFRVCIDSKTRDKFLDPDNWADGIVIRPWKFKPKGPNNINDRAKGPEIADSRDGFDVIDALRDDTMHTDQHDGHS